MTENHDAATADTDVREWIGEVLRDRRRVPRITHSRIEDPDYPQRLIVGVGGPRIHLGHAPPGWEVELAWRQEGSGPTEMEVAASIPPERLIVSAWPSLTVVKLGLEPESGDGWAGIVDLRLVAAREVVLNPGQVVVSHLAVHAGDLTVNSRAQPLRVDLHSASLDGVKRISGELTLKGSVQLPSGFRSAKTLLVGDEVTVQRLPPKRNVGAPNKEPPPIGLGAIGVDSTPVRLAVEADVVAETLPPHSTVDVDKGARFTATGRVVQVAFRGEGTVRLVRASSASFGEYASPELVLESGSMLEDASGKVRSLLVGDATVTGLREGPLAPQQILEAAGSELDGVDLTELSSIASIQPLRSAHRVVPAMPSKFDSLEEIAQSKPPGMTPEARQVFWAQLSDLVAEKKAPGSVQSALRFVAAHARLRAAPRWSRERSWLRLYWHVGYGERIGRPLLIYLTAAALVFGLVVWSVGGLLPANGSTIDWRLGWDLLVLPLSFFRLTGDSVISGGWLADASTLALRVGGVLMVFFSLAAVRRLTKAE